MKPKVALLLYGQPRGIGQLDVFESHNKHFLSKYDVDTYAHLWWSPGDVYEASQWDPKAKPPSITSESNTPTIIAERYLPKKILVEPQRKFELSIIEKNLLEKYCKTYNYRDDFNFHNIKSQLFSISAVGKLLRNTIRDEKLNYDWVILLRYDIVIDSFSSDLSLLDKNLFYHRENQWNFPDLIHIFNPYFLPALNTFYNFEEHLRTITANPPFSNKLAWEPSPECFKFCSFRKYFPSSRLGVLRFSEHRIDREQRVSVGIT